MIRYARMVLKEVILIKKNHTNVKRLKISIIHYNIKFLIHANLTIPTYLQL